MPRPLDIIVPVHNEEGNVDELCDRVERLGYGDALVFVDNASTDGTLARLARRPGVRVVRHEADLGYGASVRDGLAASDGEAVVVIDADLEWPPEAIPSLLDALRTHPVVYASRFLGSTPDMSLTRRLGNRAITGVYNLLYRQHTTDLCTGMKAFRRRDFPIEGLTEPGFEGGIEFACLAALLGYRIHDVAVRYAPRQRGRSKMRHVREALRFLRYLLRYRLSGHPSVLQPAR